MDLVTLSINLEKEPTAYLNEYRKQLTSYTQLVNLSKQPDKVIRQTLDFLLRYPNLDESLPEVLLDSLQRLKTYKLRKSVISSIQSLCFMKKVKPCVFIKCLLEYATDVPSYINKCKNIVDQKCRDVLLEYYEIGNENQKTFCYYFIVFLFSKYGLDLGDLVCKGLFEESKVRKFCYSYFLENVEELKSPMDLLDSTCKKYGVELYKNIVDKKDEREYKVLKMRVFVLFRNRFQIKASVIPLALSMLDPNKEDVKDIMNIIVDSVNDKEVLNVIKVISDYFCSPFKDDDMVCYGLNLLRGIYCKFDETVKDSEEGSSVDEETNDMNLECSEEVTNGDTEVEECNDKDIECFEEENILSRIKEHILSYVECFKGNKSKSITYAYRSVINVINHRKNTFREIDFILKKLSKEERKEKYGNDLTKAERKEMFMKKSKRKYKLSKKKIRSNSKRK